MVPLHATQQQQAVSSNQQKIAADDELAFNEREARRALLALGITAFGLGAGTSAMRNLPKLFRAPPGVDMSSSVPTSIPIRIPASRLRTGEDEEKTANGSQLLTPVGVPAALATAVVGAGTGSALIDWLVARQQKARIARRVEDAKAEYDTAMQDAYKQAMSPETSDAIDELYDEYVQFRAEKLAGEKAVTPVLTAPVFGNLTSNHRLPVVGNVTAAADATLGLYLATLLGLGGTAGYFGYQYGKGHNKDLDVGRRALDLRARQRMAPQPTYAVPVPA